MKWRKASVLPRPRFDRSCFQDRCSQLVSACLPEIGTRERSLTFISGVRSAALYMIELREQMAAQVGFAPTPARLTGGRTTVIRLSNKWSGRRELHSRPPRSKRGRLLLTIRPGKMALSMGLAPTAFPQTTGRFSIQLRELMVGSAGNAPVRHFRLCFLTPDLQSGRRITSQ